MNKEMMKRLRTAGKYQKKALRALFPEEMSGHLDVIEGEVKAMFMDLAFEMINSRGVACFTSKTIDPGIMNRTVFSRERNCYENYHLYRKRRSRKNKYGSSDCM